MLFGLGGCAKNEKSDAYGRFEATETTISSKASGELLMHNVSEGAQLTAGKQVAQIDTTTLHLQK